MMLQVVPVMMVWCYWIVMKERKEYNPFVKGAFVYSLIHSGIEIKPPIRTYDVLPLPIHNPHKISKGLPGSQGCSGPDPELPESGDGAGGTTPPCGPPRSIVTTEGTRD